MNLFFVLMMFNVDVVFLADRT